MFWPFIPKQQILKEIGDSLNGRWIGQGPKVKKFEAMFGKKFGYKHPLMVNSGTSALELSYHLIGLKKGDEVIVPVLDCTAGQMGLLRLGVKIVFADVDKNLNIDPEDVKRKLTKNTKAIVGVHVGGIPFSKKLNDLATFYNIPLIVDAAQHMAKCKGDFICYSFQAIKHISTCDGGMLVVQDKEVYERAKRLRWFGIDRDSKEKKNYQAWEKREMTFDIDEPGFKMQPTDIDACFGLAAFPYLDELIAHRKKLADTYRAHLPKQAVVLAGGSYWLFGVFVPNRDELAPYLLERGIDNNLAHLRNDIFSVFKKFRSPCPKMDELEGQYLYLPINHKVSEKDVKYICKIITEFYAVS